MSFLGKDFELLSIYKIYVGEFVKLGGNFKLVGVVGFMYGKW